MTVVIAGTGASGMPYFVELLKRSDFEKYVILSRWAKYILKEECNLTISDLSNYYKKEFGYLEMNSPFASGSNYFDAYVIIPCSLNTLAKIAYGIADTLITRIAEVALKERRKLILCIRDTPLSTIAIKNMQKVTEAGAIVYPLTPAFYTKPKSLEDIIKNTVDRIVSLI
ncbi:MAG: UbiX family flavin prenyltransferase, partial [bacterium]|nr:UbiX family flavin prenyltransferase [bacterium]